MGKEEDIERLVDEVTRRVMERLTQGAEPPGDRRVLLLLPAATGHAQALAALFEQARRGGAQCRVIAPARIIEEMERCGLAALFGPDVSAAEKTDIGPLLAGLGGADLIVLGSVGFQLARRLAGLEDEDPFVRVVTQGLLRGTPVVVLVDDLRGSAGAAGGRAASEADRMVREMDGMGCRVLAAAELPALMLRLSAAKGTLSRAAGDLVTEADVTALADAGERRLVLPPRAIVTPLAASRAAELGLEIARQEP